MAGSFSADLAAFAAHCGRSVEQTHRAICIKLFSSVIMDTPVDTGALRGNWNLSMGNPDSSFSPTMRKPGAERAEEVSRFQYSIGGKVYLTNGAPYAIVAEYGGWEGPTEKVTSSGYSRKAPEGMVRRNVSRIHKIISEAAAEGRRTP